MESKSSLLPHPCDDGPGVGIGDWRLERLLSSDERHNSLDMQSWEEANPRWTLKAAVDTSGSYLPRALVVPIL